MDVDGYPARCYVCGQPCLKTGLLALQYHTTIGPYGETVAKTVRHTTCKP